VGTAELRVRLEAAGTVEPSRAADARRAKCTSRPVRASYKQALRGPSPLPRRGRARAAQDTGWLRVHCAEYTALAAETHATPFQRSRCAAAGGRRNAERTAAGLRVETYPGDARILQIWMGGDP